MITKDYPGAKDPTAVPAVPNCWIMVVSFVAWSLAVYLGICETVACPKMPLDVDEHHNEFG